MLLDSRTIASSRLASLGIGGAGFASTGLTVSWQGAMQAQDLNSALWSIGLRRSGRPTKADVLASLDSDRIVRTWPMRGTLHMMDAADVRWVHRLLVPRTAQAVQTRFRQLGLTADLVDRCRSAVRERLADGAAFSRQEVYATFTDCGVDPDEQRGYNLIAQFARECLICFGAETDAGSTFVLLDHWTAGLPEREPEDPVATLAMMYLRSHGPATPEDFARWTGLTLTVAREGFQKNRDRCASSTFEHREYWWPIDVELVQPDGRIHLLPGFDEFALGYGDRSTAIAPEWKGRIAPGGNGVFRPTIVHGGQVVGTWSHKTRGKTRRIETDWWVDPDADMTRAAELRAQQFLDFVS